MRETVVSNGVTSTAEISDDGMYRYELTRCWDDTLPSVCYVMLNPSTADAHKDDATIRRCIGFAKAHGAGSIVVVNLFAWRATNPAELRRVADPIGPSNDEFIRRAAKRAYLVVAAWGANGGYMDRDIQVLRMIGLPLCLSVTNGGHPCHPLRLSKTCRFGKFTPRYECRLED